MASKIKFVPQTAQEMHLDEAFAQADAQVVHNLAMRPTVVTPEELAGLQPTIVKTDDNEGKSVYVLKTYGEVSDKGDPDSLGIGKYRIMRDLSIHNPFLMGDKTNEQYFVCVPMTEVQARGLNAQAALERMAVAFQAIVKAAADAEAALVNRQQTGLADGVQELLNGAAQVATAWDNEAIAAAAAEEAAEAVQQGKVGELLAALTAAVNNVQ